MIIPREHFDRAYELLRQTASAEGCSVLVLCARDADALCCLRVLTALLQADDVAYRKRPVATLEDLRAADAEIGASAVPLTALVLINCGGGVSLREALPSVPDAAVVYVIDSHRPYHPANVEDEHRIILFGEEQEPASASSAAAEDGDDDEDEGGGSPPAAKRPRQQSVAVGAFFGPAAALTAFRVAEAAHKEKSSNVLWWALVGCTDQWIHRRVTRAVFEAATREFELEIRAEPDSGSRMVCETELQLVLLKHWTLYESMLHTPAFATKLGIWRQNGRQQLDLLLAKMGVPLVQAQQQYVSMPSDTKRRVADKILDCLPASVTLDPAVLFGTSFQREFVGTRRVWLSASDVVYAVTALVEDARDDAFWSAYNALSGDKRHLDTMMEGISLAMQTQRDIVAQAAGMIAGHAVVLTGPLRYAILSESALLPRFVQPLALSKLAHFVMDAVAEVRPAKKPFILCAYNEKVNAYLTVAIATGPLSATNTNSFGLLFERAARQSKSRITHHGFDSAVLEVQKDDLANFIETLNANLFEDELLARSKLNFKKEKPPQEPQVAQVDLNGGETTGGLAPSQRRGERGGVSSSSEAESTGDADRSNCSTCSCSELTAALPALGPRVSDTAATCITLARHVVGWLGDPRDVAALAEACPQLLAGACARRIAQIAAPVAAPASSLLATACELGRIELAQREAQRVGAARAKMIVERDDFRLFRAACQGGNTACAAWLADSFGIDRRGALARNGWAFWMACARGKLATAQWFARRFALSAADVRANGNRAFCEALANGHVDVAAWLAAAFGLTSSDARARNNTALVGTCAKGQLAAAKWLFSAFKLTAADARSDSCTALASACLNGHADVAVWLLSREVGLTLADARAGNGLALQAMTATPHQHVTRAIEAQLGVQLAGIATADTAARAHARPQVAQLSPVLARRVDLEITMARRGGAAAVAERQFRLKEVEPMQCGGWAF